MPGINTRHREYGPLCHKTKIYPTMITVILLFSRAKKHNLVKYDIITLVL